MIVPKNATHYDYMSHDFYMLLKEKYYKYNGFGWDLVKKVNFDNLMRL